MSSKMAAPGLNPKGCVKAVARLNFRACDACVVRSGMKPSAVEFSPKSRPGIVPFIHLCGGAMVCGMTVGLSECFADAIPFSVGTYSQYLADLNYAQCLEEGGEGWQDPFAEGSLLAEGVIDLTGAGDLKAGDVCPVPLGAKGAGFMVPKDGLTLYAKFGKEDISDYSMGNAAICVEVCNP